MAKVIIIGIDGFDPTLLIKWRQELACLEPLIKSYQDIAISSTFPPDSICAWTSIYTGQSPAEHGLIESIDYLSTKKPVKSSNQVSRLIGNTFWDEASKLGKKVCVINPFLAYPSWAVNGIMISGPVFEGGDTSVYPSNSLNKYSFPPLGGIVDFPNQSKLRQFIRQCFVLTNKLAESSFRLYDDNKPDLFFVSFFTLDRIKHFLWRYTDKSDPTYPGKNPYQSVIKDFYYEFDCIIKRFFESMEKGSVLVILSDHGHLKRCTKLLNLNEYFRQQGMIYVNTYGIKGKGRILIEKIKVFVLESLDTFGIQDLTYKIAKIIPNRKSLKKSTYLIDRNSSKVSLGNVCGANPFGGIKINCSGSEYEILREKVIDTLLGLNNNLRQKVVKWAEKRENIYSGSYEGTMPDVLFELESDYGVGMNFFVPIITNNYTHRKVSGGHQKDGVFIVYSQNERIVNVPRPNSIVGVKDYLLKTLNL